MDSEDPPMFLTQDGTVTIVDNDRGWDIMSEWREAPDTKPDGAKLEVSLASVDDFREVMDGVFTGLLEAYSEEFAEYLAPYSPIGFRSSLLAAGSEYRYRVIVTMGRKKPRRFHSHMAFEEGSETADGMRLFDIEGAVSFHRKFIFLMTENLVEAGILPSDLGAG